MTDRESIQQLIAEFAWLLDHGKATEIPRLFTETGRLKAAGQDIEGQEALQAAFNLRASQAHTSRHVYTNLRVVPEGDDRATGTSILTAYRHEGDGFGSPTPTIIADTSDVYERGSDGRWYFAERVNTPVFMDPELLQLLAEK